MSVSYRVTYILWDLTHYVSAQAGLPVSRLAFIYLLFSDLLPHHL